MLGKKITDYFCFLPPPFLSPTLKIDYFCFLPPPFLSPTLKIVILFLFSAASSSPNPNSFAYNFMCELLMFHLSSLFSAFFFSLTWFPFLPFILNSIP
jgi:hypothetical protein